MLVKSNQLEFLRRSFANGTMVHAYLLVGPAGVGKKETIAEVASWFLNRKVKMEAQENLDFLFIEKGRDQKTGKNKKEVSIEDIHKIRSFLNHHSLAGGAQIVVLNEADYLSRGAANALLKTLEEPKAAAARIFLLAERENEILSTIKSRCQIIRFLPVATEKICEALKKAGAGDEQALELARISANRPELALSLLQNKEDWQFYENSAKRFWAALKGGLAERFKAVADLFEEKTDHKNHLAAREKLIAVLDIWQILWRDLLLFGLSDSGNLIKNIGAIEKIKAVSKHFNSEQIVLAIQEIEEAKKMLRANVHPKLILENLIISNF